jgi:SAM-dependent methyltransferase
MLADHLTQRPGPFPLVRCLECELAYLNPRPDADQIDAYYPSTYEPYAPLRVEDLPRARRWLVEYGLWKRCRPLLAARSSGVVLDVGCGAGLFVAAMRKYGNWESIGIDRSPGAVAFARETLGVDARVGTIEACDYPDRGFDAVTMWDTLEHLHHPRRALGEVWRMLRPGGLLLLRVPSLDSLDARLFGPSWAGLDAPRHLTVFSRRTLTHMLAETGFSVDRMWCMSGSHASFAISVRFALEGRGHGGRLGRWLLDAIGSPIAIALSAPYFYVVDRLTLGPEITVLCRRQGEDDA